MISAISGSRSRRGVSIRWVLYGILVVVCVDVLQSALCQENMSGELVPHVEDSPLQECGEGLGGVS